MSNPAGGLSTKKDGVIRIDDPIYDTTFFVFTSKDHKAFKDDIKRIFPDLRDEAFLDDSNDSQRLYGAFMVLTGGIIALWVDGTMKSIAHEVYHAVTWLMGARNIANDELETEPGAYLTGFLMNEIGRHIKIKIK
jgi:hypothetical protein